MTVELKNINRKIAATLVAALLVSASMTGSVAHAQDGGLVPPPGMTDPSSTVPPLPTLPPGNDPAAPTPSVSVTPLEQTPGMPTPPPDALAQQPAPTDMPGTVAAQPDGLLMPSDPSPIPQSTAVKTEVQRQREADKSLLLANAGAKRSVRESTILPESMQTLFFTVWQHALLEEAKVGFRTALPEPGSLGKPAQKREPGIREVALGGIAYSDHEHWTVWLNGVRITPNAIPEAVIDIKVSGQYIDLKWFDGFTNRIYPIRLRPQERFNLDSRIFLPGAGSTGAM